MTVALHEVLKTKLVLVNRFITIFFKSQLLRWLTLNILAAIGIPRQLGKQAVPYVAQSVSHLISIHEWSHHTVPQKSISQATLRLYRVSRADRVSSFIFCMVQLGYLHLLVMCSTSFSLSSGFDTMLLHLFNNVCLITPSFWCNGWWEVKFRYSSDILGVSLFHIPFVL